MCAGSMMSYSIHKAANAIARIHLAVHNAKADHDLELQTLAINDGLFILSPKKSDLVLVLRTTILYLVANLIARGPISLTGSWLVQPSLTARSIRANNSRSG